jgi:hypothetical protein
VDEELNRRDGDVRYELGHDVPRVQRLEIVVEVASSV